MPSSNIETTFDVIIIGGGPSGLAAATRLRQLGVARVLLIERQPYLGGIPVHTDHFGFAIRHLKRILTGPQYAKTLTKRAYAAGVTMLTSTTVFHIDPVAKEVTCVSEGGHTVYRSQAILAATGCRETTRSALLIPGFRGRGVMSTSEAQQYIHQTHELPGKRIVIFGSEDVGMSAVHTFGFTRARVVAMIEEAPRLIGRKIFALGTLLPHRVRLHTRHTIKQILGKSRVEAVEIVALDNDGALVAGTEKTIKCDTVIISGKFIPEAALVRDSAIPLDERTRGPAVDQQLQTDIPGIFASGNLLRGVETADVAALEGEWAAVSIAAYLRDASVFSGQRYPLVANGAIRWIMPQRLVIDATMPPPFLSTLRVGQKVTGKRITADSSGHNLWQSRTYLSLVPERRIRLNIAKWKTSSSSDQIDISLSK